MAGFIFEIVISWIEYSISEHPFSKVRDNQSIFPILFFTQQCVLESHSQIRAQLHYFGIWNHTMFLKLCVWSCWWSDLEIKWASHQRTTADSLIDDRWVYVIYWIEGSFWFVELRLNNNDCQAEAEYICITTIDDQFMWFRTPLIMRLYIKIRVTNTL